MVPSLPMETKAGGSPAKAIARENVDQETYRQTAARKTNGGFWRSLQQDVPDDFDRGLEL